MWYVTYWLPGDSEPREYGIVNKGRSVMLIMQYMRKEFPRCKVRAVKFHDVNDLPIVKMPPLQVTEATGELGHVKTTA